MEPAFKKKIFFLCMCLGFSFAVFAQKKNISFDTTELRRSLKQAEVLIQRSLYDSAVYYCNSVLSVAKQNALKFFEVNAYDKLADVMLLNGKMAEVRHYDSLAIPIALQLKDTLLIINTQNRSGVYYTERGNTKEAESRFLSALNLGLEKQQSVKTAEVYSNFATLYLATGSKDKAMEWFFKALRLYEKHSNDKGLGLTYSNISSVHYLLGRTNEAIGYQKKSIFFREKQKDIEGLIIPYINIGQLYILKDSNGLALQYLQQAVKYADQINNPRLTASAYSGMSTYYSRVKDFLPALVWQTKAIGIFEETDNKPMLSRLYVSAGNLANATKDSSAALDFYNKALNLARQLGNKDNIANAYEKLSNFYQVHNDYDKAYQYYKRYIVYKDSITASGVLSKIEEIKIQYETEKKDNEIARLNTDQKIKQLEIEKQKAIISGNRLETKQKENEIQLLSQQQELRDARIKQQGEELEKQFLLAKNNQQELLLSGTEKKLKDKQIQSQKQLRNLMIGGMVLVGILGFVLFNRYQLKKKLQQQNALLAVRNNIAKDLHDEIGSALTSIKILSQVSHNNLQKDQQKASSMLEKITEQSSQMQQGMSDIVWAITPENDKLENMVVRMREYIAHTLEPRNIQTSFEADEKTLSKSLSMEQRRDFFLIFKEAINNAAKYSGAGLVDIRLSGNNGKIHLAINDNGIGFDTKRITSSNGLRNMRARTEALKGKFCIHSSPGNGVKVELEIPAT